MIGAYKIMKLTCPWNPYKEKPATSSVGNVRKLDISKVNVPVEEKRSTVPTTTIEEDIKEMLEEEESFKTEVKSTEDFKGVCMDT